MCPGIIIVKTRTDEDRSWMTSLTVSKTVKSRPTPVGRSLQGLEVNRMIRRNREFAVVVFRRL